MYGTSAAFTNRANPGRATAAAEIVGASKIPGGKLALIEVIWATLHAR